MSYSISEAISNFMGKRSFRGMLHVLSQMIKQKRVGETIYSLWDFVVLHASKINNRKNGLSIEAVIRTANESEYRATFCVEEISENLKNRFPVKHLPANFTARIHSLATSDVWLVIGEYSETSARLFYLNSKICIPLDNYLRLNGVAHIHSILKISENELAVSTGDSMKVLDLWSISSEGMSFKRRILKKHAGFTTCANVKGKKYFGTDFSQRPNYIYRLDDGRKWPYPRPSFRKYSVQWKVIDDRYIVSLNKDLEIFGGTKALSVFDTKHEEFIASEICTENDPSKWTFASKHQ